MQSNSQLQSNLQLQSAVEETNLYLLKSVLNKFKYPINSVMQGCHYLFAGQSILDEEI